MKGIKLDDDVLESLAEIVNIGVGRAAASLSLLLGSRIDLKVPIVRVMDGNDRNLEGIPGISISQEFEGPVAGKALLMFPVEAGRQLAGLLAGYDESEDLPDIEISGVLSEVGNIVLNGVLGSLANITETHLDYSVPDFFVGRSVSQLVSTPEESQQPGGVLIADTEFSVASEDISGSIVIAFEIGALESLVNFLKLLAA